jgi:hypothetical protein
MNRNALQFLIGVQSSPNRREFCSFRGGTAAGIRGLLTAIEGRACARSASEIRNEKSASQLRLPVARHAQVWRALARFPFLIRSKRAIASVIAPSGQQKTRLRLT